MDDRLADATRELVLERFFDLSADQQVAVYRAVRDHVAAPIRQTKRDKAARRRADSLEAMRAVAEHLQLAAGVAPTTRQFDAAARELGLGWSSGSVQRAWGRWRFAVETFVGKRLPDSYARADARRGKRGRRRAYADGVESLRWWLKTNPKSPSLESYRAWAREFNETRPESYPPVLTAPTAITAQLGIVWSDAVRWVSGEITWEEARSVRRQPRQRLCRGPHDLVSKADIAALLGRHIQTIGGTVAAADFPRPVMVGARRNCLWERADVDAYLRGEPFPIRVPNEARNDYMSVGEVAAAFGLSTATVRLGRLGVPPRAVSLGGFSLWLRTEVDAALADRG